MVPYKVPPRIPRFARLKPPRRSCLRAEPRTHGCGLRAMLRDFLDEQCTMLLGFADQARTEDRSSGVLVLTSRDQRRSAVEDTIAALDPYAA